MAIRMNGSLRFCLAGSAIGGLIAFAYVPTATAQWLPPWRWAPPPVDIEQSLEAQGYVLTAPLMRRPGVYLADVSAGPAGYQRLVVDARSGQILERFIAPGRMGGPALAARDEGFGEPQRGDAGPPAGPGFSAAAAPTGKSAYSGPASIHIPAAVSPYGPGEAPAGTKPRPKSVSTERKAPPTKLLSTPPLPPPAPREAARPNGSGLPASRPAEKHDWDQPKIDSRPTEVDKVSPAAPPTTQGPSVDPGDKPKVSIVPPALFE
ncbi:MAG TPA: hypothetical protein VGL12_03230 [Roseiarcus sp.]|jgi:hypothetical protein